jgi:hypothetical protein
MTPVAVPRFEPALFAAAIRVRDSGGDLKRPVNVSYLPVARFPGLVQRGFARADVSKRGDTPQTLRATLDFVDWRAAPTNLGDTKAGPVDILQLCMSGPKSW